MGPVDENPFLKTWNARGGDNPFSQVATATNATEVNPTYNRGLTEMGRQVATVVYVVAMAAVIVGVDFAFFRNRLWERLAANIGIVLVFVAFYFRFLRRP